LLARFVSDITIPDGTIIAADSKFNKVWRMRNEGNVAWPLDTQLIFVGGDNVSETISVSVGSIKPGGEIDISVQMKSPVRPGRYTSFWRLSGDATRFGHRVWTDILVSNSSFSEQPQKVENSHPENLEIPQPPKDEVPVVVQQPKVEISQPVIQDSSEVEQMVAMGFTDRVAVRAVLKANNNDVYEAVQAMLNN